MIVDFHTHVFPPAIKEDRTGYLERDAGFNLLYQDTRSRIATADDLLAGMNAAGVDLAVMLGFGWADQALCLEHSDYLMAAASRHPDRLINFGIVQPLAAGAAASVRRLATERPPVRGLGELRPEEQGYGLDDQGWASLGPVAEVAKELDFPMVFHASEPVGHPYPGKGRLVPERLLELVQAFPDQKLVLAHLGGLLPFYAAMPEVRTAMAHTWVDTAAWPLLYGREVLPALASVFGVEKVLFGSDFPLLSQHRVLEQTRASGLTPPQLDRILGDNAVELLGLGAARHE
ncbi:MAG: hypothetical protein EXR51_05230 [Dehalococcoidia bacterium]|nr:hypothetical protein [Dehalococcoidia bacterium]